MRLPSYYSSSPVTGSSSDNSSKYGSNLSRSSFSSPTSSTYATRSHLPYVPTSMLVAHCISGTSSSGHTSSTKPSYQATSGYSTSYSRPISQKRYQPSVTRTHHLTTPSTSSSLSSSSIASYHSSRLPPTGSYISSSYSGAPRSSYLSKSSFSNVPGSVRTSYRPSAIPSSPSSSSSYNYRPIRLRDRPLLTQISRHINTTSEPRSSQSASEYNRVDTRPIDRKVTEETWSSDEARNISRNKYLIKFREFDKRKDSLVAPINLTDQVPDRVLSAEKREEKVEPVIIPGPAPVFSTIEVPEPELIEDDKINVIVKPQETEAKPISVEKIEIADEAPSEVAITETKMKNPQPQTQIETDKLIDMIQPKACVKQPSASPSEQEEPSDKLKLSNETRSGKAARVIGDTRKPPRERRNIKLKIKPLGSVPESEDENRKEKGDNDAPKLMVKKTELPDSPVAVVKQSSPLKLKEKHNGVAKKVKAAAGVDNSKLAAKELSKERSVLKEVPQPQTVSPDRTTSTLVKSKPKLEKNKGEQLVETQKSIDSSPSATISGSSNKRIRFREYKLDDFNFLSVLGHGGWGFVILAELKGHGDACFAVKCIKKITIVEDDDFDSIMIERKMLTLGNLHPFICKLFCTFETEGYLFFAMEYCAGGDLMFHVQKEGKFTEARCRFYAAEIICAIRFLHNRHIIYRDLKLDNILLDATGHVRLVDFGMCQCRTYREEMLPSNFCGTPEYISPEIIKGVPYNHSVDWWSFGVLLYEMAVGKMPFRGSDENELLWNVCYEQIHYPMFLSKDLTSLLQLLLEREPVKRMGMATCKAGDIYDQPWFRGVDWTAVEALRVEPPFVPEVNSNRDVQNFDADFTESRAELSPMDEATLQRIDQSQFQKFPYTNPDIHIFDSR